MTTGQRDPRELDRIADMMRSRIHELIAIWQLRNGYRDGHDWICCNPLRDDRKAGSFRIVLSGPLQGMVTDFAGEVVPGTGKKSVSPLTFHIARMHDGDKKAAVDWVKDWLGLTGRNPTALRVTQTALNDFDKRPLEDAEAIAKKRRLAQRIFLKARPILGTPGWDYFKGRGIDLGRLPALPNCLRFEERCYCGETQLEHPAIVMPINSMTGEFWGCHRIWIEQINGVWRKSRLMQKAKRALGAYTCHDR